MYCFLFSFWNTSLNAARLEFFKWESFCSYKYNGENIARWQSKMEEELRKPGTTRGGM